MITFRFNFHRATPSEKPCSPRSQPFTLDGLAHKCTHSRSARAYACSGTAVPEDGELSAACRDIDAGGPPSGASATRHTLAWQLAARR